MLPTPLREKCLTPHISGHKKLSEVVLFHTLWLALLESTVKNFNIADYIRTIKYHHLRLNWASGCKVISQAGH